MGYYSEFAVFFTEEATKYVDTHEELKQVLEDSGPDSIFNGPEDGRIYYWDSIKYPDDELITSALCKLPDEVEFMYIRIGDDTDDIAMGFSPSFAWENGYIELQRKIIWE